MCNVILFLGTILLFGIAIFRIAKPLTQIDRLPKVDAKESRLVYAVGRIVLIGEMMSAIPGKTARETLLRFPKRTLSPLRRACLSLGLPINARPQTNLAWRLKKARLGKTAIEYLKWSEGDEARQIVELYHSLNTSTERKAVTIDYLIMAAGADVHRVWGLIQEEVSRLTSCETEMMVYVSAPDVTQKAIEYALTPGGHKDRELLLGIAGVLPVPAQTRVTASRHCRAI